MPGIALSTLLALLPQDAPAPAVRVALQPDGTAVVVAADGTASEPLFGSLADRDDGSLWRALQNYSLLGSLGLFLGAPRPLATMVDADRYCAQAGIGSDLDALRALLEPPPATALAAARRSIDHLIAIAMLARSEEAAARDALALALEGDDRFAAAWARHLLARREGGRTPFVAPQVDLATALAAAPAEAGVFIVVDHARAPEWQQIWRIMVDVMRAHLRDGELTFTFPEGNTPGRRDADLLVERSHLLGYEITRRFGNACLARTTIATASAFTRGPGRQWIRFDGWFEPDRVERGLRAEKLAVDTSGGPVRAALDEGTWLEATAAALTVWSTTSKAIGAKRGQEIAAAFDLPHLAAGVVLLHDDALGEDPLPEMLRPLLESLRGIFLRHNASDGAHLWLEFRYAEARPAAAAAVAAGALLATARASAAQAPAAVREMLRELRIERQGANVVAEVELEEALGPWLEKVLPLLAR